jgi:hypothetical protein
MEIQQFFLDFDKINLYYNVGKGALNVLPNVIASKARQSLYISIRVKPSALLILVFPSLGKIIGDILSHFM